MFCFSSRRRHTRWPRDWSSDVCSSDLGPLSVLLLFPADQTVIIIVENDVNIGSTEPFCCFQLQIGRASCRERVWSQAAGAGWRRQEVDRSAEDVAGWAGAESEPAGRVR